MNLIIPGLARTGTRSLWRFFDSHYQVAASKTKEPIRENGGIVNYLDNFEPNERTLYLFDGTPELTNFSVIHDLLAMPEIDSIKQIWLTRDPVDRIKSVLKRLNRLKQI